MIINARFYFVSRCFSVATEKHRDIETLMFIIVHKIFDIKIIYS